MRRWRKSIHKMIGRMKARRIRTKKLHDCFRTYRNNLVALDNGSRL